jgi:hypothetical protein
MIYTQTDKRWKNEIMTESDGRWIDRIGRWGCLVTCLSNIISMFLEKFVTPDFTNRIIRQYKAYNYLNDETVNENSASVLLWDKFKEVYEKTLKVTNHLDVSKYREKAGVYYIACVEHSKTHEEHFVNVLAKIGNDFNIFDVEDGKYKLINEIDIKYFHKIESII